MMAMAEEEIPRRQRLRVTYRHGPELRYVSHLDLMRALERAMRRARLPLAYSQGFTAHPRIVTAAPLPVGFTSEAEVMDIWLSTPVSPSEFAGRLAPQLPVGLTILSVEDIPLTEPALPTMLRQARYRVSLPAGIPLADVRQAVERFLSAPSIPRPKRGKGPGKPGPGSYDLRPLVVSLEAREGESGPELEMVLVAEASATGRPDEVLDALGYGDVPAGITRMELIFERAGG